MSDDISESVEPEKNDVLLVHVGHRKREYSVTCPACIAIDKRLSGMPDSVVTKTPAGFTRDELTMLIDACLNESARRSAQKTRFSKTVSEAYDTIALKIDNMIRSQ